jgi:hypothetical protein
VYLKGQPVHTSPRALETCHVNIAVITVLDAWTEEHLVSRVKGFFRLGVLVDSFQFCVNVVRQNPECVSHVRRIPRLQELALLHDFKNA